MKKKDRKIEKENFKDRLVEAKLREYKNNQPDLPIREHEIQRTLLIAEKAFFQSIQERTNSYFDFLFQQAAKELIHIVKHVLKGLVQFFRVYQSRI